MGTAAAAQAVREQHVVGLREDSPTPKPPDDGREVLHVGDCLEGGVGDRFPAPVPGRLPPVDPLLRIVATRRGHQNLSGSVGELVAIRELDVA
jgi:hypothetical protein